MRMISEEEYDMLQQMALICCELTDVVAKARIPDDYPKDQAYRVTQYLKDLTTNWDKKYGQQARYHASRRDQAVSHR